MTVLTQETLENGLLLSYEDHSNRYFGDYHRVCVRVVFTVEINAALLPDAEQLALAQRHLGESVRYEKDLQRMGVPTAQVESVRDALIDQFRTTTRAYVACTAFPRQFVVRRLTERRQRSSAY